MPEKPAQHPIEQPRNLTQIISNTLSFQKEPSLFKQLQYIAAFVFPQTLNVY
tara:strand:- start:4849 stop:5004 length:156 start_codon:yes stop_codon:yes gene_type:complete